MTDFISSIFQTYGIGKCFKIIITPLTPLILDQMINCQIFTNYQEITQNSLCRVLLLGVSKIV